MKILIIEDDKELAYTLKDILEHNAFDVMICFTFEQAYQELNRAYDCYLIDNRLPDGCGLDLCKLIREITDNPIVFISSDTNESSILKSYEFDADDYIEKPFRIKVLLAKIQSVLKRAGKWNQTISLNDSILNLNQQTLTIEETTFSLSISEVAIVESLFSKYPNYVSRQDLAKAIYSKTNHETSLATVSTRVSELNSKLNGKYIESSRNKGYRWIL